MIEWDPYIEIYIWNNYSFFLQNPSQHDIKSAPDFCYLSFF